MNAKIEFIEHTDTKTVKCATIMNGYDIQWDDDEEPISSINLPCNYTSIQYEEFLEKLDFEYDAGYGGQELFGTIWYTDGTWSNRYEYDGSEWWVYQQMPIIPEELLKQLKTN